MKKLSVEPDYQSWLTEFGLRMKIAVKVHETSIQSLLEKTRINRTTIWQILNGKSNIEMRTVFKLVKVFNLNPALFLIDKYEFNFLYDDFKNVLPSTGFRREVKNRLHKSVNLQQDEYVETLLAISDIRVDNIRIKRNQQGYRIRDIKASKIGAAIGLHLSPDQKGIELGIHLGNLFYVQP
jgi:transcriptional regulator with XRE-family HTH domain